MLTIAKGKKIIFKGKCLQRKLYVFICCYICLKPLRGKQILTKIFTSYSSSNIRSVIDFSNPNLFSNNILKYFFVFQILISK